MDNILEQVEHFAAQAHEGQRRKYADEPFVQHPIRVMRTCRSYTNDLCVLSAALLHDVVEDTSFSRNDVFDFLQTLMPQHQALRTVMLVEQLTDVYIKSSYPQWNRKKRKKEEIKRLSRTAADAQTIKYADIMDNCQQVIHDDAGFAHRFLNECNDLLKKINRGNSVLYLRAQETVARALAALDAVQLKT